MKLQVGFLSFLLFLCVGAAADELRIGVLAKRGSQEALERWQATALYLNARIPQHHFLVQPLDFEQFPAAVERQAVDFAIVNSAMSVALEVEHGAFRIATLRNRHLGQAYTDFGGVIFVRADDPAIQELGDLRGRSFMAVDSDSLGGFLAVRRELHDHGIDPYKDLKLSFGGTHDAVAYAVRDRKVAAGTVRSDTLERMAAEGKIQLADFRAIHQQPGFPLLLSSRLYPEWPVTALAHVDRALVQQVALALMQMPPDSEPALAAQSAGWAVPGNYEPVHELLKDLALPPYEFLGRITWHQLAYHNRPALYLALAVLLLTLAYMVHVSVLNRRLARSGRDLRRSLEQLERARERLVHSEKMAAIGQLAAGVAHELNNPMGYIRGNLNTLGRYARSLLPLAQASAGLAQQLPPGDPQRGAVEAMAREAELDFVAADLPQLVGESIEGADRMSRIITDLRNFASEGVQQWTECDLNDLMEHSLAMLRLELEAKATLVRELAPLPPVRCVPAEIEQALVHLLNNACQAIAGRGTITVRSGRGEEGRVWVEVQDTGAGIAEEHRARIFEPFFTTRAPGKGVGLGLSLAYNVVRNHGGEIQVTSRPGAGATFRIVLPEAGPAA